VEVRLRAGYVSASDIYVNVLPSKRIPWLITCDILHVDCKIDDIDFLERVKERVLSLPVEINLPRTYTGFPRYYLIKLRDIDEVIIEDIVGVKWSGAPTKWSYKFGYWHPQCQIHIAQTIYSYLKYLKAQAQQTQTQSQVQTQTQP